MISFPVMESDAKRLLALKELEDRIQGIEKNPPPDKTFAAGYLMGLKWSRDLVLDPPADEPS